MEIDLSKGFGPWKEMFIKNEHRLNAHGGNQYLQAHQVIMKTN